MPADTAQTEALRNMWRMLNSVAEKNALGWSVFLLYPENEPSFQVQALYDIGR